MIKPKVNADTKVTIVMWCWVFIRSTQRHLADVSAGGRFRKLPVYLSRQFRHGTARAQSGEAGTIEAASV